MKIKTKLKTFLATLAFLLVISLLILTLIQIIIALKPVRHVKYKNIVFEFRDDVKKAEKIKVYPNEKILGKQFWDYKIQNITLMFKPDDNYNKYYQLAAFELTYKLKKMYMSLRPLIIEKNFEAREIENFDNITREEGVLKIIFVPPEQSNETIIKVSSNRIYLHWETPRDLDLATIKIILSALEYNGNYSLVI
ncbi:MAG: hypothetical protein N3E38_00795 [Candidatus Aenigmarchaeota archaeon]|nr:hypothetical protein [Candidatus Aenigmarchaeota archaeon]